MLIAAQERSGAPQQIYWNAEGSGEVRKITGDVNSYLSLSVGSDSRSFLAVQSDINVNVWVGPGNDPDAAVQVTSGRMDGIGGLAWTTDGRIVYQGNVGDSYQIWMVNADGSAAHQVTNDRYFHTHPAVCESGHSIVFESDPTGLQHLFKTDLDGNNLTQITSGAGEGSPSCRMQSGDVVFSGSDPNRHTLLYKMELGGASPVALSDQLLVSKRVYSPDGTCILAALMDPKTGTVIRTGSALPSRAVPSNRTWCLSKPVLSLASSCVSALPRHARIAKDPDPHSSCLRARCPSRTRQELQRLAENARLAVTNP